MKLALDLCSGQEIVLVGVERDDLLRWMIVKEIVPRHREHGGVVAVAREKRRAEAEHLGKMLMLGHVSVTDEQTQSLVFE